MYIICLLSKLEIKHTSLKAAYTTQTPFPPTKHFSFSSLCRISSTMTFGKGQLQPNRKRTAPRDLRRSKTSRKQAREQVKKETVHTKTSKKKACDDVQQEAEAVDGDFNELLEPAEPRESSSDESDEDDNEDEENPYLERYGEENWEAELKKAPAMRKYS
jgi:hypothetical protein